MEYIILVFCTCVVSVFSFLLDNVPHQQQPVVNTHCGPVRGTHSTAYVFKGIPYALPPTKQRRWKPPEPLRRNTNTCWSGTFNASMFGNTCFQFSSDNSSGLIGSEDCLFLNVWTPTLDKNANLPVMVWIHGGSLQSCSGNWPEYSPTSKLANTTNTVYVSMNYRLHAFGFMALDILSRQSPNNVSGNYGFMDQQLALQWVQMNIKNFGGNPNLVTVFGQSSGGTSIIGLLSSPLSVGLFHRALIMSASPVYNKTLADASKDNLLFLNNTGCHDIDCLYNLPADDIIHAIPYNVYPYWGMDDQLDPPTHNRFDGALCIVDGYVVPEPPFDMWKHHKGIDVPVIVGTTAQEVDMASSHSNISSWTWEDYQRCVHGYLDTFLGNISAEALSLYPDGVETPEYQYTTLTTDVRMTCPTDIMTYILSTYFKSPVYRYVLQQRPSYPVEIEAGIQFKARYSFHNWDSVGFFGVISDYYTPTKDDRIYEQMMQREMLHFARTGKPYTDSWKTYPRTTGLLDTNVTVVNSYHAEMCKFWDDNHFFSYGWIN